MAQKKQKTQAEKAAAAANKNKKNNAKTPAPKKEEQTDAPVVKERLIPLRFYSASLFLGLFLLFLVIFFVNEGALTGIIRNLMFGLFGVAGFVVAIPIMLYLFFIHAFSAKRPVIMRTVCLLVFVVLCGCIFHLFSAPDIGTGAAMIADLYTKGSINSGGIICGSIVIFMNFLISPILTGIVLLIAAVICLFAGMQITIPSIIRAVKNRPRPDWENEEEEEAAPTDPAAIVVNHIVNKHIEHVENKRNKARLEADRPTKEEDVADMFRQIDDVETPVCAAGDSYADPVEAPLPEVDEPEAVVPVEIDVDNEVEEELIPLYDGEDPEADVIEFETDTETPEQKPETKSVVKVKTKKSARKKEAEPIPEDIPVEEPPVKQEYCYPPIDLLKLPANGCQDGTDEMRTNSERLRDALASFKIDAHIVNVTRGPSITRYEVELEKGVRLSKLTSAAEDLALSLGASGVRIAAIPDKISVVGIEVPNKAVNMVSLREVIDSPEFVRAKSKSTFALGKDIGGSCIVGNIAKLPHMLIAGTTGSGKSVCTNSIIISLLYKASPDEVKLIMIDPKMVELGVYNDIPHLLIPVVTDPKKAAGSLQWAVTEMMRRYKAMRDVGVRDLESYNSIMMMEDGSRLPQVVVIIDELADLMIVAAKEVEESICRIAQMGRAAGIHLIIATQRPSADVITGLMKANIPSRIAFSVSSAMESRIILDTQGAEKLVGRGDMLYAPIGVGKPKRVQGCFVSDGEVEAVATYVKDHFASNYDAEVIREVERASEKDAKEGKKPDTEQEVADDELFYDEMLPDAVEVILETKQASVSMLQRRLKLGYARAARIVDEMEERGIVGPHQGSKARDILITREQWEQMKSGPAEQMSFDEIDEDAPFDTDE